MTPKITVCFVHFRTCDLAHFERAWWSVSQQRYASTLFSTRAIVFDNNSLTYEPSLRALARAYGWMDTVVASEKHGDPTKTHPYSVNAVVKNARYTHGADWVLFTRSDYILAPDAVMHLMTEALSLEAQGKKAFVSGWCYQSAYTREQVDLNPIDPDSVPWRQDWGRLVDGAIPGYCFAETDQDAGVWLTRARYLEEAGWMNEQLSAWGYAQSTFQRELKAKAGVTCATVPRYLFFHQHHGVWARDHEVARQQYHEFGGGR